MVTDTWANRTLYEIKGNVIVDLEMELSHILMDLHFLSLGLPDWLSLCLFGGQTPRI